jgi:adenylate kinase
MKELEDSKLLNMR